MSNKIRKTRKTTRNFADKGSVVKYGTIEGWQISIARNGSIFDVCEVHNGALQHASNVTFFQGHKQADVDHAHYLACDYAFQLAKNRMGEGNVPSRFFRDNVVY